MTARCDGNSAEQIDAMAQMHGVSRTEPFA
jgi:hypothetical protein